MSTPTLSFDHVHLQSSQPEATIAFFETMFGAKVVWTHDFSITRMTRLAVLDLHINLFWRAPKVAAPDPDDATIHHFCLRTEEFDATIADLHSRGANFVGEPAEVGNMRVAFISGPDNLRIEILYGDA